MRSLKQTIDLMQKIIDTDYNDEYEIFVDQINGEPKFIIQEKLITIQEVKNGI